MHFLTNKNEDSAPNTNRVNSWNICHRNRSSSEDSFVRHCTEGIINPLTRVFSILTGTGLGVGLREVEIYGFGQCLLVLDMETDIEKADYPYFKTKAKAI